LLRNHGVKRKTDREYFGEAAIIPPDLRARLCCELRESFGRNVFPAVAVGQWLDAQPAIRVGTRGFAQYNLSELSSWKTSAPNLQSGRAVGSPGDVRVARRFPKILFMLARKLSSSTLSAQVICHPRAWGVTFPVFHFQISTSNWRAKATMACLRRRECTLGLRSTACHFLTR
jgi:hypothetical protein